MTPRDKTRARREPTRIRTSGEACCHIRGPRADAARHNFSWPYPTSHIVDCIFPYTDPNRLCCILDAVRVRDAGVANSVGVSRPASCGSSLPRSGWGASRIRRHNRYNCTRRGSIADELFMDRRVVSHTLLLALLLTQWVNAHRRYDGCAACGRPPAPHVHLSELVPFGERPQSCRCGTPPTADDRGCCSRQASGGEKRELRVPDPADPTKSCCADVLLLSGDSEVAQVKVGPRVESPEDAHVAAMPRTWLALSRHASGVDTTRPPPGCRSAPLYLVNRALLI